MASNSSDSCDGDGIGEKVSPRHELFGGLGGHNMVPNADALAQHSDKFDAPYKATNSNDTFASQVQKILGIIPPLSSVSTANSPSVSISGSSSINIDRHRLSSTQINLPNKHYTQSLANNKILSSTEKKKESHLEIDSQNQKHHMMTTAVNQMLQPSSRTSFPVDELNLDKIFKEMTEIKPFIKRLGEQHVTSQNKNIHKSVERAYPFNSDITYNNAKNNFNGEEEFGSSNKSKHFQPFKNQNKDNHKLHNFSSSPNNVYSSNLCQNTYEKNAIEQAINSNLSPSSNPFCYSPTSNRIIKNKMNSSDLVLSEDDCETLVEKKRAIRNPDLKTNIENEHSKPLETQSDNISLSAAKADRDKTTNKCSGDIGIVKKHHKHQRHHVKSKSSNNFTLKFPVSTNQANQEIKQVKENEEECLDKLSISSSSSSGSSISSKLSSSDTSSSCSSSEDEFNNKVKIKKSSSSSSSSSSTSSDATSSSSSDTSSDSSSTSSSDSSSSSSSGSSGTSNEESSDEETLDDSSAKKSQELTWDDMASKNKAKQLKRIQVKTKRTKSAKEILSKSSISDSKTIIKTQIPFSSNSESSIESNNKIEQENACSKSVEAIINTQNVDLVGHDEQENNEIPNPSSGRNEGSMRFKGEEEGELLEEDEGQEEPCLATIIKNLQSPANSGSKKSSASSSSNTSPQLPSFGTSVYSTAISVPTSKVSLNTLKDKSPTNNKTITKENPSVEPVETSITFTLSDDEISDDSNASHHNMKTAAESYSSIHQNKKEPHLSSKKNTYSNQRSDSVFDDENLPKTKLPTSASNRKLSFSELFQNSNTTDEQNSNSTMDKSRERISSQQVCPLSAGFAPTTACENDSIFRSSTSPSKSPSPNDAKRFNKFSDSTVSVNNTLQIKPIVQNSEAEENEISPTKCDLKTENSDKMETKDNVQKDGLSLKDDEFDDEIKQIMNTAKELNNAAFDQTSNQKKKNLNTYEKSNENPKTQSKKTQSFNTEKNLDKPNENYMMDAEKPSNSKLPESTTLDEIAIPVKQEDGKKMISPISAEKQSQMLSNKQFALSIRPGERNIESTEKNIGESRTSTSSSSDHIQYSPDGRPKLLVSIELDLLKILSLNSITSTEQYFDQVSKMESFFSPTINTDEKVSAAEIFQTNFHKNHLNSNFKSIDLKEKFEDNINEKTKFDNIDAEKKKSNLVHGKKESSRKDRKCNDNPQLLSNSKSVGLSQQPNSNKTSFEKIKAGSNKYTDEINITSSLKRSSVKTPYTSVLETSEEYDPEDALYSSENINKKPKLEHVSSRISTSKSNSSSSNKTASSTTKDHQSSVSESNATGSASSLGFSLSKSTHKNTSNQSSHAPFTAIKDNKFLDFLDSPLEELVLVNRGKQKKHEADGENDKYKKATIYMEAVCYFCMCAITQYRLKKTNSGTTQNKSSFGLLENTYDLLKYINTQLIKPGENEIFQKKFKVLSNWIESFINRCFYVMYIKESSLIRDSIKQYHHHHQNQQQGQQAYNNSSQQCQTQAQLNNNQTSSRNGNIGNQNHSTNSPQNEPPPPSPASSVGSTNSNNAAVSSTTINSSQQAQDLTQNVLTSNNINASSLSNNKILSYYEKFFKMTESNVKSQMIWDTNESQICENKYLNDFRETIKAQVKRELHIDSEVEIFAAYVFTGLHLFKLNQFEVIKP